MVKNLIKKNRQAAGLSLRAAAAQLGVSYTYISKIENGLTIPSEKLARNMAKLYGGSEINYCFGFEIIPKFMKRQLVDEFQLYKDIWEKSYYDNN